MHTRYQLPSDNSHSILYVSYTQLDLNFKATYHSHPNLEILYICSGKGYIQTSTKKIDITKGDLVIINPHSKHCEVSINDLKFIAIGINKMDIYLKESFNKKIIYFPLKEDEPDVEFLFRFIFKEAQEKKEKYLSAISSCLNTIMVILNRKELFQIKDSSEEENYLVANAKSILDNAYYQKIKVEDIAHRLSVSSSTLSHEFKKVTGLSIIEYKLAHQLEEADNLLHISDMSIQDIASSTGFYSSAYFTKAYKKRFGHIPSKTRKTD